MAQNNFGYTKAWQEVELAMKTGKPKTALTQIEKILAAAKKEKNEPQWVKALVYKARSIQLTEEDAFVKIITDFEKEIKIASQPAQQILYSVTADLYQQYFNNQRWKIYNRSNTADIVTENPETWSVANFNERIGEYHKKALLNAGLLQKTKLEFYLPIIDTGNTRYLRPTLYDLLAFKALAYYQSGESEITKPVYAFQLKDAASLSDVKTFLRYNYSSKDSVSHLFKSITLYQEILQFHLNDANPAALIDANIARLQFAYNKSTYPGKENLYKKALEQVYQQYPKQPEAMQAGYLIAAWWSQKGNEYQKLTGTEEDRMAFQIAAGYCRDIIKKYPKSEGGINATNLLQSLQTPSLSMQVEKVNVAGKPFRGLLTFKNIAKTYFRIVSLPLDNPAKGNDYEEENTYWKRITQLPVLKAWNIEIPVTQDLREHSVEIKIETLPKGSYLLIASNNADFTLGLNPLLSVSFYVSNISFVNSDKNYFVLNRENGQPLPNAQVQTWYREYDYSLRRTISRKGQKYQTNNRGYFDMGGNENGNRGSVLLEISTGNDYLFTEEVQTRFYNHIPPPRQSKNEYEEQQANYFFFTDRSIYRPGQTLFFKAIGLTHKPGSNQSKLYHPNNVEVILLNANYETVASQTLTPNEYASISGQFNLPTTGLTGSFQIQIKKGDRTWQKSFQVEEYKRPKFYVSFDELTGTYRLNDTISLNGKALGYAGNVIDGATVAYRVTRSTRFLYPWYFSYKRGGRSPYQQSNEMEITNGTLLTKEDGSFEIPFKAIPDETVNRQSDPGFDYRIEAVVTDINGETRTEETTVTVGYKSLLVNLNLPTTALYPTDSVLQIGVSTTNLNGVKEPAKVNIILYKLEQPNRLIRKRLWEAPDTFVISRQAFLKDFPNDPYQEEDDYHNWKNGEIARKASLDTRAEQTYRIDKNQLSPGYYRVEATSTDKDGGVVKSVGYLSLFDADKGILPGPAYLTDYAEQQPIEPGQTATFWQGTTLPDAYIIQQTLKSKNGLEEPNGSEETFDFPELRNIVQRFQFDAKEADRGGYQVNRVMIYQNRIYTQSWMVQVPWTNKELKISLETFRDKLLPGQNETWKVKIAGHNKDQVAAELLASMYDASLDQFLPHQWTPPNPWATNYFYNNWTAGTVGTAPFRNKYFYPESATYDKRYDELISLTNEYGDREMQIRIRGLASMSMEKSENMAMAAPVAMDEMKEEEGYAADTAATSEVNENNTPKKQEEPLVQIRKNFNETAFFFPDLKTDAEGTISFSFTMPEALTAWKLQLLAHTTDARFAYATQNIVTQKQLMILPNPPRFFRQGDEMELSVKLSNLTDKELTGQIQLELLNASTGQPVDGWFRNVFPNQYFTVAAGQSNAVKFPIEIPYLYDDAVIYRLIAKSGDMSDGEEMALPVLTNKILVTESFPLNIRNSNKKVFDWKRFTEMSFTNTDALENHSMTIEYTTNPAWYAVQALPYLMEYPYDCAEQTWNRYYANALASKIANSTPKVKSIFESWKNLTPEALQSNLEKNQELKSALLEETPWVLDAKNESAQKKNIGLLFDMVRMQKEAANALNKLKELQSSNGGFVWFKGGADDRYMTQYILTGIGHLKKLNALPADQQDDLQNIISKAIPYLDNRIEEDYQKIKKSATTDVKTNHLSHFTAQYLYMRSFFKEVAMEAKTTAAYTYFTTQAETHWLTQSKYDQGMIALALYRNGKQAPANKILASLIEYSIQDAEMGMYWKEFNNPGLYWWQAPIESHALLTEAFAEIENSVARIDDLKTWLLKQKQTTNWKTTKATAEACYALLLSGTDWLQETPGVVIKLGNYVVDSREQKTEAGTGYFKAIIPKEKINASMGKIEITLTNFGKDQKPANGSSSWGAAYWQYFQDADKVTAAETNVAIKKNLYVIRNTDRGPVLEKLEEGKNLQVGDRVKVRVEIKSDRQMEYVHLKDMRASCFEPANVLSGYKYQDGLGYYEATKDASSNFFIGYLPRGTWVFEYELRTTHSGQFSNGITTLQSMYAPEFSTHSKGMRVIVD